MAKKTKKAKKAQKVKKGKAPKRLSKAVIRDLEAVLQKHGIKKGALIGRGVPMAAGAGLVCPPGTRPTEITVKDEAGNWVTKILCL